MPHFARAPTSRWMGTTCIYPTNKRLGRCMCLGRLVGFEPTTSRTTIWRYYQLSYSRRTYSILAQAEIPARSATLPMKR